MNERPRRRRPSETRVEQSRGTFPLLPLLIVVVLAGLGLGALMSRHFGSQRQTTTTSMSTTTTTVAAPTPSDVPTQAPSPSLQPSETPSARPAPSSKPSAAPRATPHRVALNSPQPKPEVKPSPTTATARPAAPTPKPAPPTAAPRPVPPPLAVRMAKPAPPKPATPKTAIEPPATGASAAAQMVRSYLGALIGGDTSTANRLLNRAPDASAFPEQSIINKSSHVTSVHSSDNGDGTYKMDAEISGSNGNFYCTYQTAHGDAGVYITDNFCIRTQ